MQDCGQLLQDRVVKKTYQFTKTSKIVTIHQKETPVEALQLNEDITSIDRAIELIRAVDTWNITDSETEKQREFGYQMKRIMIADLRTWKRYATLKFRREYLAL